jgi:hypothetical protein
MCRFARTTDSANDSLGKSTSRFCSNRIREDYFNRFLPFVSNSVLVVNAFGPSARGTRHAALTRLQHTCLITYSLLVNSNTRFFTGSKIKDRCDDFSDVAKLFKFVLDAVGTQWLKLPISTQNYCTSCCLLEVVFHGVPELRRDFEPFPRILLEILFCNVHGS